MGELRQNSPAHRPSGGLDNHSLGNWLFPPIVPQRSPGAGEVKAHKWECLLFSMFWPLKKMLKNQPLKKRLFWPPGVISWIPIVPF